MRPFASFDDLARRDNPRSVLPSAVVDGHCKWRLKAKASLLGRMNLAGRPIFWRFALPADRRRLRKGPFPRPSAHFFRRMVGFQYPAFAGGAVDRGGADHGGRSYFHSRIVRADP